MFVILCYDVSAKRLPKLTKTAKKYLYPMQNSVFEGHLTPSQLKHLQNEIQVRIDPAKDSVLLYTSENGRIVKYVLGVSKEMKFIL